MEPEDLVSESLDGGPRQKGISFLGVCSEVVEAGGHTFHAVVEFELGTDVQAPGVLDVLLSGSEGLGRGIEVLRESLLGDGCQLQEFLGRAWTVIEVRNLVFEFLDFLSLSLNSLSSFSELAL